VTGEAKLSSASKPLNEAVAVGRQRMEVDDGSSVKIESIGEQEREKRQKRESKESMRSGVTSYLCSSRSR
jgi:hypothetical protein